MKKRIISVLCVLMFIFSFSIVSFASSNYTNVVSSSINESGSIYNGVGYKDNVRPSSLNSGVLSELACANSVLTGYIPYSNKNDVIRISGVKFVPDSVLFCYLIVYDSNFKMQGFYKYQHFIDNVDGCYDLTYDELTDVYTISLVNSDIINENTKYIRLNCYGKGSDLIVTINEDINFSPDNDGSGSFDDNSGENKPDTEYVYIKENRPFFETPLSDYSVTEGILLLIFVVTVLNNVFKSHIKG